jgi:ABC-2 type transport system ATP-binding protein
MTTSIVVDNVSKTFRYHNHRTLKQVVRAVGAPREDGNDLQGPRRRLLRGGAGGVDRLMGLNGSGKSTLLKLINGVMRPDEGQVLTRGRISGLIATGAGFHKELTGRQNIYMNAAILGMSKQRPTRSSTTSRAFADVGRFMDTPVGNYSSGMFARLGFSVAVHVDCDIFIADEVLAVGDKPFKTQVSGKMEEIRESGVTLFYVSHAAGSVKKHVRARRSCWSRAGSASTVTSKRASSTSSTTVTTWTRRTPRIRAPMTRSPTTSETV